MAPVLVSTPTKRLFLRVVKADAAARNLSLDSVLLEYATAQVKATKGGVVVLSTSTNGQSFTFAPPGEGLDPEAFTEMVSDLLDRYDTAKATLADGGNSTPSLDQIYDSMMAVLFPITEVRTDFSFIDYGSANRL